MYLKNPTDPTSLTESVTSSTAETPVANQPNTNMTDPSSIFSSDPLAINLHNGVTGMPGMTPDMSGGMGAIYNDSTYEVFDPLNWMLDGLVGLPYNVTPGQGLDQTQEGAGGMGGIT